MLSDYEQSILSTSQFILAQLDSFIESRKIDDYDPLSNESILSRLQLQRDLIATGTKQAELEQELLRLDK